MICISFLLPVRHIVFIVAVNSLIPGRAIAKGLLQVIGQRAQAPGNQPTRSKQGMQAHRRLRVFLEQQSQASGL